MFTKERKVLKDLEERLDFDGNICKENEQAKQIWSLKKRPKIWPLLPRRIDLDRQDVGKGIYQRDTLVQSPEESNHSSEFW